MNKDKVFITNRGALEGRIDSYYYKPFFVEIKERIKNSPFALKRLNEIALKVISGYDSREFVEKEEGIPYLRVGNVKAFAFDLNDVKYIPQFEISKDIQLQNNDLLITRKGSFGNAVIVNESVLSAVISSEVFRIPLNSNVIPKYVEIWLNTNTAQYVFEQIKTGAIMGHITQEVLKNVIIPLPPLEKQREIVALFQAAYESKRQKEAEAKQLLAGIDAYLMQALGIAVGLEGGSLLKSEPPSKPPFFYTKAKEVMGNRWDAFYYKGEFGVLIQLLYTSKFIITPMREILSFLESGSRPSGGVSQYTEG
ncbi:MAG: restriction endonuclease subunit S, partial [Bacteroidia bacterium]